MSLKETNLISEAISRSLDEGSAAVLVTLIGLPLGKSEPLTVGAKLLIKGSGERVGSLGGSELDDSVAKHIETFLASRDEARFFKAEDFAPDVEEFHGASLLFERIEAEPRLVICGAGHVGASLAR